MMSDIDFEVLLEEVDIGGISLRNRFVRSATHEWLAAEDGTITSEIIDIYEQLAENFIGLIISGYSHVTKCGKSSRGQQAIWDDRMIPGYAKIAASVREYESAFFVQIVHGGRHGLITEECPKRMAPSSVPLPGDNAMPKEMSKEDIDSIIDHFVRAIERVHRAKADGVQIHCAHGFLLSSFLSPYTNRREDDWGGDTESRTKIVLEILRRSRKKTPEFPIAVKMNTWDGVEGGIDKGEAVRIARILDSEDISAIEVSGGIEDAPREITCMEDVDSKDKEAYFREYSKAIKGSVKCPVILVGGNRSIDNMSKMVSDGYADLIALSRPLIREPDLISKFLRGDAKSSSCISCNGCFDETGIKCNIKRD